MIKECQDIRESIQTIEKEACIQAVVKVIPKMKTGEIGFECIGEPTREPCEGTLCPECDFVLSQMIRLSIPVKFSAKAEVIESGIICDRHCPENCKPELCGEPEPVIWMNRRDYQDTVPGRSFARNILMTYQNNPD